MFLLWDGVKALTLHSENDKQAGLFRALDRRLNLNRNTRVIYFKRLYEGGFDYEEKENSMRKNMKKLVNYFAEALKMYNIGRINCPA